MGTVAILGYETSSAGLEGDVEQAWDGIDSGGATRYLACANPHSLVEAGKDPVFQKALKQADILLPDGIGIIYAAKLLGLPLKERVAGSEFFWSFSEAANARDGVSYYFLGSSEEVLDKIAGRLAVDYPRIAMAGTYSPPFKEEFDESDNEHILQAVNEARPTVLWVGMTAPKQEKWIYNNRHRLEVPFVAAIGAVFDFYAGTKKRAPDWVCNMGLEWLPRLIREPKRLFRRNFVSTPLFLTMVLREKLRTILG